MYLVYVINWVLGAKKLAPSVHFFGAVSSFETMHIVAALP
jgi:hypothetical protein